MPDRRAGRTIQFFRKEDARDFDEDGMMTPPSIDESVWPLLRENSTVPGQKVQVLFKDVESGFSLVSAWFGANFRLPRHSHDADCLYYVLSGEAHLGNRVLGAGEGFFVKAGAPYTYTAGPDGVQVLEFRTATAFDMTIFDRTPERWRPIIEAVQANRERWLVDREQV